MQHIGFYFSHANSENLEYSVRKLNEGLVRPTFEKCKVELNNSATKNLMASFKNKDVKRRSIGNFLFQSCMPQWLFLRERRERMKTTEGKHFLKEEDL